MPYRAIPFKGQIAKAKAAASAIVRLLTAELGLAVRVRAECSLMSLWAAAGGLKGAAAVAEEAGHWQAALVSAERLFWLSLS